MHRLIKPIILILITLSVGITYNNKYNSLTKDFESSAKSEEAILNKQINLVSGYIEVMSVYGDMYYNNPDIKDSEYFKLLKYNSHTNTYNMDSVEGTTLEETQGNLTGKGRIPFDKEIRNEINFAMNLNQIFGKILISLPEVTSLFYVSENEFVYFYPFKSSAKFNYSDDLKNSNNYNKVKPENNPNRKSFWSVVSYDKLEKQLTFSYSTPIYLKDNFSGVIIINFSNSRLSELMDTNYEGYLIDENGYVIASSHQNAIGKTIFVLNDIIKIPQNDYKHMWEMGSNEIKLIGDYYIYSNGISDAPWRLFMRVSFHKILMKSLLTTIPVLLISIFLVLTVCEIDKRRKTEKLLKDTIAELKAYQRILETIAKTDSLTTTFNRRGLKEKWSKNLINIAENEIPVSVLLGDIDDFKKCNDTYGHPAGDKILVKAADILKKNRDEKDIVCRWGGEEFLIMLYNKDYDEALAIAEKIRKEMALEVFAIDKTIKLNVTMTIGVAQYKEGETLDECVARADKALYMGKESGKNRVVGSKD